MTEPALPPMAPPSSDIFVLPPGLRRPRPTDGPELAALIRDLLVHWGAEPRLVDLISVDAELAGSDITRLTVTASNMALPDFEPRPASLPKAYLDEVVSNLGEVNLLADAVRWEKAEFHGSLHLERLAVTWLLYRDELVGIRLDDVDAKEGRGRLRLETDLDPLIESIRLTTEKQLKEHGLRIRKLNLRATELGERSYRVEGRAAISWKMLPLSARLTLIATIDDHLVLRLTDVRVSSGNPLCAIALAFARRPLLRGLSEPIPLRDGSGFGLVDLSLRVEPRLLVEASFADLR